MSKKYEELDFTDDFFFCKILMKNKRLCKELLELILQIKISKIIFSVEQKPIEVTADGKGAKSDLARRIDEEVNKARAHEEWKVEYMSLFLRDQEKFAEGEERGREEKTYAIVINMLRENMTIDVICRVAECEEAYVKKVQEELDTNYK